MLYDDLMGPARPARSGLAPLTWIVLVFNVSILCVLLDRERSLWALFVVCLAAAAACRPTARQARTLVLFAAVSAWAFLVGQGIFYSAVPRTPVLTLIPPEFPLLGEWTGGVFLYREGLTHGLVQSLRMTSMLCLGLAACWTVQPQELLLALTRLRMPYGLAFMAVTAFRFLPAVAREAMTVATVQALRGHRPSWQRPMETLEAWVGRLRTIFAGALRRATTLTMAVQGRGFRPGAPRTAFREARFGALDRACTVGLTAVTLALAAAKGLHALHVHDVVHVDGLRWLYRFVREAL